MNATSAGTDHDDGPEDELPGGTVTPIARAGDTVRRATGEWSPAVHALLLHLEARGFAGAPQFLGVDDRGREVLCFVEGEVTTYDAPAGLHDDRALIAAARLLRAYHDAMATFVPPPDARWRYGVGAPRSGPVVCHNDLGPYNSVYRGGVPVAFLDWDLAAPAPPEWDVVYALWRFVPLYDDERCRELGWPVVPRGPRMRLFCDAYGLQRRDGLLGLLRRRQQVVCDSIERWAADGDVAYAGLCEEGRVEEVRRDMAYAATAAGDWQAALR